MSIERRESTGLIILEHGKDSVEVYTKQGDRPPKQSLIVDSVEDAAVLLVALQAFVEKTVKPVVEGLGRFLSTVKAVLPTIMLLFECDKNRIFRGDFKLLSALANAKEWKLTLDFEADFDVFVLVNRAVRSSDAKTIIIGGGNDQLYLEAYDVNRVLVHRKVYSEIGTMDRNGFVHLEESGAFEKKELEEHIRDFAKDIMEVRRFIMLEDGATFTDFNVLMLADMSNSDWFHDIDPTAPEFLIYQSRFPSMARLRVYGIALDGILLEIIDTDKKVLFTRKFPMNRILIPKSTGRRVFSIVSDFTLKEA